MQRLLRFRTGCHGLPSDVGGHQAVPRHQRICPFCADGLGDEKRMHLEFECTALQDLRVSFAPLFQRATIGRCGFHWLQPPSADQGTKAMACSLLRYHKLTCSLGLLLAACRRWNLQRSGPNAVMVSD